MSATPAPPRTRRWLAAVAPGGAGFRDRPLVPLLLLLAAAGRVLLDSPARDRPPTWVATTIRFATPLAILAACQTLTMLTGGIDLSVATVASMAAFVMATSRRPARAAVARHRWRCIAAAVGWASSTASASASSGSIR